MASFFSCSLLSPLLVITLFIQPASSDPRTQQLIDQICRQCEDFGFCNTTFNENLKAPTTNVEGLAQITIEQSLYNATNTYIFVKRLLADTDTTDVRMRDYLTVCDNSYYAVMELFREAFRSFDQKDYRGMMFYEWKTSREVAICDGIFVTEFLWVNPLGDQNKQMRQLITMALVTGFMLVS
ncbi:uncharacterized protein LOC114315936 [Camellia sinensis]|uniref:uncharacterized protein LOC114315936 n=1 Tax=Camellia sinensis TaxID=4442 RepID=UPI00103553B6|nr:uncharacterized protein LOC114315936 [Camellia sinensis]